MKKYKVSLKKYNSAKSIYPTEKKFIIKINSPTYKEADKMAQDILDKKWGKYHFEPLSVSI